MVLAIDPTNNQRTISFSTQTAATVAATATTTTSTTANVPTLA
jgi:hypothetical protein